MTVREKSLPLTMKSEIFILYFGAITIPPRQLCTVLDRFKDENSRVCNHPWYSTFPSLFAAS